MNGKQIIYTSLDLGTLLEHERNLWHVCFCRLNKAKQNTTKVRAYHTLLVRLREGTPLGNVSCAPNKGMQQCWEHKVQHVSHALLARISKEEVSKLVTCVVYIKHWQATKKKRRERKHEWNVSHTSLTIISVWDMLCWAVCLACGTRAKRYNKDAIDIPAWGGVLCALNRRPGKSSYKRSRTCDVFVQGRECIALWVRSERPIRKKHIQYDIYRIQGHLSLSRSPTHSLARVGRWVCAMCMWCGWWRCPCRCQHLVERFDGNIGAHRSLEGGPFKDLSLSLSL